MRDTLANQLGDAGFRVYDETAATIDKFQQGRCRRQDDELIDIARSIRQPTIDVVVLFRVYAVARELDYTTKVAARVEGRLLDVHAGRRLGNFEVDRDWNVGTDCRSKCVVEAVRGHARGLAQDLGAVLAVKLGPEPDSLVRLGTDQRSGLEAKGRIREYVLKFENFTVGDIDEIEDYLRIFSCYQEHRPDEIRLTSASYTYHSCLSPARLSSNLNRMLAQMQRESSNTFSTTVKMSGNAFTVHKVVRRNVQQAKK